MTEKPTGSAAPQEPGLLESTHDSASTANRPGSVHSVSLPREFAVDLGDLLDRIRPPLVTELRLSVRRPDDLLVFDVLVDNLRLEPGAERPRLVRHPAGQPARLIVEFPPQSFGEQAFVKPSPPSPSASNLDGNGTESGLPGRLKPASEYNKSKLTKPPLLDGNAGEESRPGSLPVSRIRMSGPSRLAFLMPQDTDELPLTLAAVLEAMRVWPLSLDPNARSYTAPLYLWDLVRDFRHGLVAERPADEQVRILTALTSSARRVSARGAGAMGLPARQALSRTLLTAVQEESAGLFERFPALAEGSLQEATLAALVLESAAGLGHAAERAGLHADEWIARFPYLPLWLGLPHVPPRNVTALELPYRLVLSPIGLARWDHRAEPFAPRGRAELWHTRLVEPRPGGAPPEPPWCARSGPRTIRRQTPRR